MPSPEQKYTSALPLAQIEELERLGQSAVIAYVASGFGPTKGIDKEDIAIIARCLPPARKKRNIDFVINAEGGMLASARRLALLIRDRSLRFRILVPYRARSACTMMSLASNEIVLSAIGELGPIDPNVRHANLADKGVPSSISAEEIRLLPEVGERWFGIKSEIERGKLLAIVLQRIFPTTLASFYRANLYARQVASELLKFNMPQSSLSLRRKVASKLITGYPDHGHAILADDLRSLGLNARNASPREDALLLEIHSKVCGYLEAVNNEPCRQVHSAALIFSTSLLAEFQLRIGKDNGLDRERGSDLNPRMRWNVLASNPETVKSLCLKSN